MNGQYSDKKLNQMLDDASKELTQNKEVMERVKGKKPQEILKTLKPDDAKKLKQIMDDPELTKKILSSPQAQALMKQFMGGKK